MGFKNILIFRITSWHNDSVYGSKRISYKAEKEKNEKSEKRICQKELIFRIFLINVTVPTKSDLPRSLDFTPTLNNCITFSP